MEYPNAMRVDDAPEGGRKGYARAVVQGYGCSGLSCRGIEAVPGSGRASRSAAAAAIATLGIGGDVSIGVSWGGRVQRIQQLRLRTWTLQRRWRNSHLERDGHAGHQKR